MADAKTEQEPSIEEILESIRQIISEDGDTAAKPAPAAAAAADEPFAENVIDLMEKVTPESNMSIEQPTTPDDGSSLISDTAADATATAMAKLLASNIAVERDVPTRVGSVTLEDMARELMRPLVKSWLDQNLPRIVEKTVQKEIDKLSRRVQDN